MNAVIQSPAHNRPPIIGSPSSPNPLHWFNNFFLNLYLFVNHTWLAGWLTVWMGFTFQLALLLAGTSMLLALLTQDLLRVFQRRSSRWILLFSMWLILCALLSYWRGGSVFWLRDSWLKSFLTFVIIVAAINSLQDLHRSMRVIAWANLALVGITLVKGTSDVSDNAVMGRYAADIGIFSNPNELANYLLIGLPFGYMALRQAQGIWGKIFWSGALGLVVVTLLRTGSRGGAIALGVLAIAVFFTSSAVGKLRLFVLGVSLTAATVALMPQKTLNRYSTIFGKVDEDAMSDVSVDVAVGSSTSRIYLLQRSLQITFEHPIFGLGPGTFSDYLGHETKSKGLLGVWLVTHNTFTEISSETGLVGFTIYLLWLVSCFRLNFRIYRNARQTKQPLVEELALCLILCLITYVVHGCFISMGYSFILPMIAAYTIVLTSLAKVPAVQAARKNIGLIRPSAAIFPPAQPLHR